MNIFDIIITIVLLFGFIRGIIKGLFVEVASLTALVAGVYGSIHFSYFASDFLKKYVSWKSEYISLTSFAVTFIIIIVIIALLGKLLTKLANFAALGLINKITGGIFGALKLGVILSVLFIFFEKINTSFAFVEKEQLEQSILYKPVKQIAPMIFPAVIKEKNKEKI